MSRNFSLQPLLDLMHDRTDEATRQLGRLVAAEQSARGRLKLLTDYRQEYARRFQAAQAQGLTLQAWRNYQEFIDKIDIAIGQQSAAVETSTQETAVGQEHWQTQNKKLKAIDTLSVRHRQSLVKKEGKQEQKQLDEFAARHYQRPAEAE
ncbi:MAG: flagellar export protein FliJ [Zoogloeaceae bacterium]|jgi:flagellar FliJ protein|nr:flagellar export protein FliJ [Zoogloeaceae bacterium]